MILYALLIILSVITFLLILIIIPFRYRIMAHCDLLHNHTLFSLRFLKLPILFGSIRIYGNRIYLKLRRKEIALKIVAPPSDEEAIASYFIPELPKMNIKKVNLYMQIGKSDDAFVSAMLAAFFQIATQSTLSVLKAYHKDMISDIGFETLFNIDHLEFTVNCIVTISIANIIKVVYKSIKRHKERVSKGEKHGRKARNKA